MARLLLTPEKAAQALGIGRTKGYELIVSGAVASVKIGWSRRVSARALTEYVASLTPVAS